MHHFYAAGTDIFLLKQEFLLIVEIVLFQIIFVKLDHILEIISGVKSQIPPLVFLQLNLVCRTALVSLIRG